MEAFTKKTKKLGTFAKQGEGVVSRGFPKAKNQVDLIMNIMNIIFASTLLKKLLLSEYHGSTGFVQMISLM